MGLSGLIPCRVWKLGDHVNTDILHPSPYFSLNEERMKQGLVEGRKRLGLDLKEDRPDQGLLIVAGENFGCGSSRETSVRALRASGVRGVVAVSFARIFFRSLINLGIPSFECRDAQDRVKEGDVVHLNLEAALIELSDGQRFPFSPPDPHIRRILECGGLIPYLERERNGV